MGRKQTIDFEALLETGDYSSVGASSRATLRSMENNICTTRILSRRIWDRLPYISQYNVHKCSMTIIHYMTVALSGGGQIRIKDFGSIVHRVGKTHMRRVHPWVGNGKKRDLSNPVVKTIRVNTYTFKPYAWLTRRQRSAI